MEEIVCTVGDIEVRMQDGDAREFIRRMASFALDRGLPAQFVIRLRLFPRKYSYPGTPEGALVKLRDRQEWESRDIVCIGCNYRQRHDLPAAMRSSVIICPCCGRGGTVVFLPEV